VAFAGGRSAVVIELDGERRKDLLLDGAVSFHYLLRSTVFFLRGDGDGNTMVIAAADENRLDSGQPQIPIVGVGREIHSRNMAEMRMVIGVRQCRSDENSARIHRSIPRGDPSFCRIA